RALLERLVDGVEHVVADLAHRVDGFLALGAGFRHRVLDARLDVRLGAAPRRAAPRRDDVSDLRGQVRDVVAQRFEIGLDVAARGRGGFARLAGGVPGLARRVADRIPRPWTTGPDVLHVRWRNLRWRPNPARAGTFPPAPTPAAEPAPHRT